MGWDLRYGSWSLQDVRLSYNRLAPSHLAADLVAFAAMYNIWSTRPAIQPRAQKSYCISMPRLASKVERL